MRSIGVAVDHADPGVVDELVHAVEATPDLFLALDPAKASVVVAGAGARSIARRASAAGVASSGLPSTATFRGRARWHSVAAPKTSSAGRATARALRGPPSETRRRGPGWRRGGSDGKVVAVVGARGGAGRRRSRRCSRAALPDGRRGRPRCGRRRSVLVHARRTRMPTLERVLDVVDELEPAALPLGAFRSRGRQALCAAPRQARAAARRRVERLLALLRASVPARRRWTLGPRERIRDVLSRRRRKRTLRCACALPICGRCARRSGARATIPAGRDTS